HRHHPFVQQPSHLDISDTRARAGSAGVHLAAKPDALCVVDACPDLHLERPLLDHAAGAVALLARLLDQLSRAVARRAGSGAHELTEHAARHLAHPAAATAGRTRADRRLGLRALPAAAVTGNGDAER